MRTTLKPTPPKKMMTVPEAAQALGIPASTIYNQINGGIWRRDIRVFKTSNVVRLNAYDVERVAGPGDAA